MAAELKKIDCEIPSRNCVEVLEELLASAKSGQMLSVAIVWNDRDDRVRTSWANDSAKSGVRDLLAGTAILQARFIEKLTT